MGEDGGAPPGARRFARMRPLHESDHEWLYQLALRPDVGPGWRYRGQTPSADDVRRGLGAGVHTQMVLDDPEAGARLGLVQLYNVQSLNGTGYLSVLLDPDGWRNPLVFGGVLGFLGHCFRTFPLRIVYIEASANAVDHFRSAIGRFLVEEGVLRDHVYEDGRYTDLHILALHRAAWLEHGEPVVSLGRNPAPPPIPAVGTT